MPPTMSCHEMDRRRKEQRDKANSLGSKLIRERENLSREEERVRRLERQVRVLEMQLQTLLGAGRVFGPVGGAAVSALSKLTLDIKIGRLTAELGHTKPELARTKSRLAEMEHDRNNHANAADHLSHRMREQGCSQN